MVSHDSTRNTHETRKLHETGRVVPRRRRPRERTRQFHGSISDGRSVPSFGRLRFSPVSGARRSRGEAGSNAATGLRFHGGVETRPCARMRRAHATQRNVLFLRPARGTRGWKRRCRPPSQCDEEAADEGTVHRAGRRCRSAELYLAGRDTASACASKQGYERGPDHHQCATGAPPYVCRMLGKSEPTEMIGNGRNNVWRQRICCRVNRRATPFPHSHLSLLIDRPRSSSH
jgi:hypothetical protein